MKLGLSDMPNVGVAFSGCLMGLEIGFYFSPMSLPLLASWSSVHSVNTHLNLNFVPGPVLGTRGKEVTMIWFLTSSQSSGEKNKERIMHSSQCWNGQGRTPCEMAGVILPS